MNEEPTAFDIKGPFGSPIEREFAWAITKYLIPEIKWFRQTEFNTVCGCFRVDFLAVFPGGTKIAFECDGNAYHSTKRDVIRDIMIFGSSTLHSLFRIQGKDIYYRLDDVLFLIKERVPELFTERGRTILDQLASPQARMLCIHSEEMSYISYQPVKFNCEDEDSTIEDEDQEYLDGRFYVAVTHKKRNTLNGINEWWKSTYDYVIARGGGNLNEIIEELNSD